ncbi:MAG: ATP-binding cassette domain-containing protein, partial [Lachnospiraceae bacterium]|nr:ATP-binding cassette domain-containing protein [Lachnospiraceae bacterium]
MKKGEKGYIKRPVVLEDGWVHTAYSALLVKSLKDDEWVEAHPHFAGGYCCIDPKTGKTIRIRQKNEREYGKEAYALYYRLPDKSMTLRDICIYITKQLNGRDITAFILLSILSAGVSLTVPLLIKALTGGVLNSKSIMLLGGMGIFMLTTALSSKLFSLLKGFISARIGISVRGKVDAAVMLRMLHLPLSFYGNYSSGELLSRKNAVSTLCERLLGNLVFSLAGFLFSLLYLTQIAHFAPGMILPSLCIILLSVTVSAVVTVAESRLAKKSLGAGAKENGIMIEIIRNIDKLKLSGAEMRAYEKWEAVYKEKASYTYNPPVFLKLAPAISLAIKLLGNVLIYYLAAKSSFELSDYLAYNSAYGGLMAAFTAAGDIAVSMVAMGPVYALARPILQAVPRDASDKIKTVELTGKIEISKVTFGYDEDMPILKDVSLNIEPGECIGITGETGSGKTTLIRL